MSEYFKYPKTMHLPWSPGLQNDDRLIESLDRFVGQRVIVTEKMDGENTTLYPDHIHARSLDSRHHPSRDYVKAFHGMIKHRIPKHYRICGENMYAEHSIHYDDLKDFFLGFSLWDGDCCNEWDYTMFVFDDVGITPVNVLLDTTWEGFLRARDLLERDIYDFNREGYVVRLAGDFSRDEFSQCVAKYVRKDHIQTDQHWMAKPVTPNKLAV